MSDLNELQLNHTGELQRPNESESSGNVVGRGEDSEGLRSVIAQMIREMLPSVAGSVSAVERESTQGNVRDVAAIQEELDVARKELDQLRDEKARQDREIFLKEELRALGVRNIDLAFRAVRDDVRHGDAKEWLADVDGQAVPAVQFLKQFISRNPELMPARMISGGGTPSRMEECRDECDLDHIRPGMDPAAMRRAREAVVKIIAQSKRSL